MLTHSIKITLIYLWIIQYKEGIDEDEIELIIFSKHMITSQYYCISPQFT